MNILINDRANAQFFLWKNFPFRNENEQTTGILKTDYGIKEDFSNFMPLGHCV